MSAPSQILSVAKPPGAHTVQSLGPSLRALPYPRPLLPPGRAERAPGDPIAWESSLGSAGPVSPKRPGHVTALPCWHCSQAHRRPGPHGGGLQASCSACPRPHGRRMPLGPVPRPCPPWGHFDALRRLTLKAAGGGTEPGGLEQRALRLPALGSLQLPPSDTGPALDCQGFPSPSKDVQKPHPSWNLWEEIDVP